MGDIQQPPNNDPSDPTVSSGPTVRLEPVTESFVVPQPWYKRIFGPMMRTETVWKLTFVAMLVVGVFIGREIQKPQSTITQASSGKARVSIYPSESRIPPDKSFQLWMTTDQQVLSADVIVTFDPNAIQLSREVNLSDLPSADTTFTSWTEANQTGVIEFRVKAKSTGAIAQGTMQIGTLDFNTTKGTSITTANIMISEDKTLIVNQDSIPFALTTTNASVTLE